LRVDSPSPEDEAISELGFQLPGVHSCRGTLHRIENVEPSLDERWKKLEDCTAGMFEGLPLRVLVNPIIDLFVVGKVQIIEGFYRAEGGRLSSEIRAADEGRLYAVADCRVNFFKIQDV